MWILILVVVALICLLFWWTGKVAGIVEEIEAQKQLFDKKLTDFYHAGSTPIILASTRNDDRATWNAYNSVLKEIESMAKIMIEKNAQLTRLNPRKSQTSMINEVKQTVGAFRQQMQSIETISISQMVDIFNYGRANKPYWDLINSMSRREAETIVRDYTLAREDKKTYHKCVLLIPKQILQCVWFFALEKPYSVADFNTACDLFRFIYKQNHNDLLLAKFYAMKQIGGEDALREPVRDMLKLHGDSTNLTLVASSLMWMNAYQSENMVLQNMLATGKTMSAKTQERLHSLTNGGGKAPSGFDVKSSAGSLYFDVSALAWKDDEYIGLFENLAFQDKTLAYSLALRDENKDLFIPQGIFVPNTGIVLDKFKSVFAEEYGSGVTAQAANCIALSGSGEEKMDGILVSANECKQMGILIHIARIGKKLIIKFYTLFMPTGSDLAAQKQQALSMYKKLSPTVTMWESSLKDTMLMAVEQLLNTTAQSTSNPDAHGTPDDPIF